MPASSSTYRVQLPVPARVVVLVSGSGTLLQALLDAAAEPGYPAEVVAVGADRDGIEGLARARAGRRPDLRRVACGAHPDRAAWDAALTAAVVAHRPDLVVSAGFMKILGPRFLEGIGCPMLNTHPALLPAFPGAHPVADTLAYGVKVTGATVHLVDDGVDTGPVLAQAAVEVRPRRHRGRAARAHQDRGAAAARGHRRRAGPAGGHRDRTRGDASRDSTAEPSRRPVRRALVSVYDKAGLAELAEGLHGLGVEIVSTGSTAQRIADAGVPVTPVEELTGFPECLDGRVKTLHPRVHAGLLADTRRPEHLAQLDELGIAPFELLVSNLYPFTETVASGATPDECVEQIDIGGPAMVRAAAKNHDSVAVVVDPDRYDVGARAGRGRRLRARATAVAWPPPRSGTPPPTTSRWRRGWATCSAPDRDGPFPPGSARPGTGPRRCATARTRTRPAALYTSRTGGGLAGAEQLHGKEMSYNNYVDADAAWRAAHDHGDLADRRGRSSTPTRAGSRSARTSPRRTARRTRRTR